MKAIVGDTIEGSMGRFSVERIVRGRALVYDAVTHTQRWMDVSAVRPEPMLGAFAGTED